VSILWVKENVIKSQAIAAQWSHYEKFHVKWKRMWKKFSVIETWRSCLFWSCM